MDKMLGEKIRGIVVNEPRRYEAYERYYQHMLNVLREGETGEAVRGLKWLSELITERIPGLADGSGWYVILRCCSVRH